MKKMKKNKSIESNFCLPLQLFRRMGLPMCSHLQRTLPCHLFLVFWVFFCFLLLLVFSVFFMGIAEIAHLLPPSAPGRKRERKTFSKLSFSRLETPLPWHDEMSQHTWNLLNLLHFHHHIVQRPWSLMCFITSVYLTFMVINTGKVLAESWMRVRTFLRGDGSPISF